MISCKVMVEFLCRMVLFSKECLIKIVLKVLESCYTRMETYILVNIRPFKKMAKGKLFVLTMYHTRVVGNLKKDTVTA